MQALMSTPTSRLSNLTIPLTILAFLALAALGYFYFYTQQRKEALHARNFRVLNQVSKNIAALNDTYLKNARNNASGDIDDLRIKALALFNEDIRKANRELTERMMDSLLNDGPFMSRLRDEFAIDRTALIKMLEWSYIADLGKEDVQVDEDNKRFFTTRQLCVADRLEEEHRKNLIRIRTAISGRPAMSARLEEGLRRLSSPVDLCSEVMSKTPEITFAEFETRYKDKLNLNYRIVEADSSKSYYLQSSERGWEIVYTGPIDMADERGAPLYFQLTRHVDELMAKVLREDVFDEFVAFRVREAEAGDAVYESIFQTNEENIFSWELENNMDSLLQRQLVEEARHEIPGIPYMIYLQPLLLSQGETLFVAGLVDRARFERQQASIPPLIIIFISFGIVLMLLSFPTLKLLLMSRNETLGVADMILSLITIMMGASLIVLILFNGYRVYIQDNLERRHQLEDLHAEISRSFFGELDAAYRQLYHYDSLRWNDPELISGKTTTRVLAPPLASAPVVADSLLFPRHYPFFNAVLWATDEEMIGDEVTTSADPTPKVNISGRQYLETLKAGNGWSLAARGTRPVYVESILTRTTGEQLAVVSTTSPDDPNSPIVFMSTRLYSLIRPVLPQGYGFCVIDKGGNVLFHSDQARNLQENFLEECTNEDFQSAIFSRAEMWAEGNYLGQPHAFYFKPLRNLPLFLITFEDKNYYRGAHAQAITLNLFFTLLFMFVMLLFLGLLYFISPSEHTLKQSHYLLDWLRPSKLKTANYRKLIFMNLAMLALLIATTQEENALTTMAMVLMSNLYAFALAFFYLNRNSYREFVWDKQGRYAVVLVILFVLSHILLWLVPGVNFRRVLLFELLPFTFLVLILEYIIQRPYDRPTPLNDMIEQVGELFSRKRRTSRGVARAESVMSHRFSYRLFFISWLLISSIFPAIKFYKISYDFERELLLRRAQVQMGQDLLERELRIDRRFSSLGNGEKLDSIASDLRERAIYSRFYFDTKAHFSDTEFPNDTLPRDTARSFYTTLISLRPRFNETVRETNRLNYNRSADNLWRWAMDERGGMNFLNQQGDFLIRSQLPKYTFPPSLFFWLFFTAFLLLLYRVVDFHINHLFNQNLLDTRQLIVESNKGVLLNTDEDVFLVVPPPPVVSDYGKVLDLKGKKALIDLDVVTPEAPLAANKEAVEGASLLLVDHFDRDMDDPVIYGRRMDWLTDLKIEYPDKQLVLTSAQARLTMPPKDRTTASNGHGAALRWQQVMGRFLKVIYPIDQWHYLNHPSELYHFLDAKPPFPGAGGVFLQIAPAALETEGERLRLQDHPEVRALTFHPNDEAGQTGHYQLAYLERTARLVLLRSAPNGVVDVGMLDEQLALLDRLRGTGQAVHLLATFSPVELIKAYDRAWRKASGKEKGRLLKNKERWETCLLERRKGLVLLESSGDPLLHKLQNRILKETVHGVYLQNMQYELLLQFDETGDYEEWDEAALIREIGQRAQLYYQGLWSSCTEPEKFMIYDLARDGIVNGKNREAFDQLLRKGIIITFGDQATIMNKSFRNFILTVIEPTEAASILSSLQREGDWSQIKKPLGVIVLVVAGFIMFTQKQLINDTLAFLAALGAVIPILQEVIFRISNTQAKVSNLIPFAGKKKAGRVENSG